MNRVQKLPRKFNPPGTHYFRNATLASQYRTSIEAKIQRRHPEMRILLVDVNIHRKPEEGRYFIFHGNHVLTEDGNMTRRK